MTFASLRTHAAAWLKRWVHLWPFPLAVLAVTGPWLAPGYLFFTDFAVGPYSRFSWPTIGAPGKALMHVVGAVTSNDVGQTVFLVALCAALLAGGYRLARAFTDDKTVAVVAGLFFLFNPFVYDRFGYGQVWVIASVACMALAFASACDWTRDPAGKRWAIFRALAWAGLSVHFTPHAAYLLAPLALAWLVWSVRETVAAGTAKDIWRAAIVPVLLGLAAAAVMNLNWVWPSGGGGGGGLWISTEEITWHHFQVFRTAGETAFDASARVAALAGFWGAAQHRYQDFTAEPGWMSAFLLSVPLLAAGWWQGMRDPRRRWLAWGTLAAAFVSFLLALGLASAPTEALTRFLFAHAPGYSGMRETQKWAAVMLVCYVVWLTWGLAWLRTRTWVRGWRAALTAFVAAVMIAQAPLLAWGLHGAFTPRPYPDDWQELAVWLEERGCDGTIVFLPWHMYMAFRWIGPAPVIRPTAAFPCRMLGTSDMEWGGVEVIERGAQGEVAAWVKAQGKTDVLADPDIDIRLIVLAKEADWQRYAWLANVPELRGVFDTPTLRVYEVVR